MQEYRIAFIGAGAIARAHGFAIAALPYYYQDIPRIIRTAVTSATLDSRNSFADRYEFAEAIDLNDLWQRSDINTVFILSPNEFHHPHLQRVLMMDSVCRIYIEKPICVTKEEEDTISQLVANLPMDSVILAGFQFLQMATVRHALHLWKAADFGNLIHFRARYLHSGYLEQGYRDERRSRLKPSPVGGAIADLGSHVFSLLVAFLGEELEVVAARQSGTFCDVSVESDLCTTVLLREGKSEAVGTVVASRISAGAGDLLELELRSTKCSLVLSTQRPDVLEIFTADGRGEWKTIYCGSDYLPITKFPSQMAPSGWLRSLIHAHYLFFSGTDEYATLPNLRHALTVQRLVRHTAEHLASIRIH